MSSTRPLRRTAALAAAALVALTACGDNTDNADGGSDGGSAGGSSSTSGEQPDVNGDGEVTIGVLSPGDLNDNGYYESFVVAAQEFVDSQDDWELITAGSINPADALEQARNMCRQGVDMVALAASELADALPAAEEDVCADTIWYLPSQTEGYELGDNVVLSQDSASESLLAAGYAMGLLMEDSGSTTAGFVTGPELDFSIIAAQAFQAGLRQVLPEGEVVTTYTGDFDDSGLAVEATQAQIAQGIGGLYPYLGGATDAAAELGFEAGIPVATPGTDRCGDGTYAISVIFDPGEYFAAALEDFAEGELVGGETRVWQMGVDPLPTVEFCDASGATPEQEQQLTDFIASVGDGTIDPDAEVERLGELSMSHDRARTDGPAPALELRGISKRYGPVVACDAVDLTVQRGEVHGLLGENGAGKSTLMKVLMGLVHADAGEVHRDGRRVQIGTPQRAAELGLGMVHQHFSLIEPLSVWENVALGETGRIDKDAICASVDEVGRRYGLVVDPCAPVDRLSAGERQRVEIIKCLRRDPKVLVLDEPTSVLTIAESAALFEVLRHVVQAEDRGVILISHKLAEITAATDVVSVLRRGRLAFSCRTADTSAPELARQMVGRDVSLLSEGAALGLVVTEDPAKHLSPVLAGGLRSAPDGPPAPSASADVEGTAALAMHGLCVSGPDGRVLLDHLDLEVGTGEVVALYGVEGNGQATLGDLLSGLVEPHAGEVRVGGERVALDRPGALHDAGVGVIPEDRHRSGVVLDMSVADNLVMTDLRGYSGRLLMRRAQVRAKAQELVERFEIRTSSIDAPLRSLSGGNQQRVVLARELSTQPTVLVAAQPTHGLDVGAIEDMYARLREAAASGVAVLLISTELEEVMALASRIAVISSGRITGILAVADASPQRLGLLLGGEAA